MQLIHFLRGAAKITITVKDTMGNLGVETSDREDSSADIKLESCDRSQDINITTPGESDLLPQKQMRSSTSLQTVSR